MASDHERNRAGDSNPGEAGKEIVWTAKARDRASVPGLAAVVRAAEGGHAGVETTLAIPPGIGNLGVNRFRNRQCLQLTHPRELS